MPTRHDTASFETGFGDEKWGGVYQGFGWELGLWAKEPLQATHDRAPVGAPLIGDNLLISTKKWLPKASPSLALRTVSRSCRGSADRR